VTVGKLGSKSYIPDGLSKAQYEKLRAKEDAAKDANYKRNVKKAGVFQDYTEFYIKRGTDVTDNWIKSVTRGHDMAKTKYDWSGQTGDLTKTPEAFVDAPKKARRGGRRGGK